MSIPEIYNIFKQFPIICTDTRNIKQNSLYFALKGANFNGNDFALQAIVSGAKYAIVDETIEGNSPQLIQVKNVLICLQELAIHHRNQFNIPVLGITGTNGKTTSKELILAVISQKFNTLATKGNFNNHIGVPLTLLNITKEHEFAIIEMGANHPGEIKELCEIADPNYGLVTNTGQAHLEGFGSYENIVSTKSALYEHVAKKSGVNFFLNENQDLKKYIGENIKCIHYSCNNERIKNYGFGDDKNIFLKLYVKQLKGKTLSFEIQTNLIGLYNQYNVMSAVTIGSFFEVEPKQIKAALESYSPSNNRSQLKETKRNRLILDAYNANPSSVTEAIKNFKKLTDPNKLLILGDMFELGEYSEIKHQEVVDLLIAKDNLNTLLLGNAFYQTDIKNSKSLIKFKSLQDLLHSNRLHSIENSLILLKGSRGMSLEKLIDFL